MTVFMIKVGDNFVSKAGTLVGVEEPGQIKLFFCELEARTFAKKSAKKYGSKHVRVHSQQVSA